MESKNKDRISQDQTNLFDTYLSVIKKEYQILNRGQKNFVLHGLGTLIAKLEDGIFIETPTISSVRRYPRKKNLAYDPERAREIREQAGLSQTKLAEQIELGRVGGVMISKYEGGRIKPSNPPKGKNPKAYMEWLKEKGYNPFNL